MLFNWLASIAATLSGSWMGQYFRTAATVPDEPPEPPSLTPVHLLPSFLLARLLIRWIGAGAIGAILLSFNLSFFWSFLLGNEQSRRWLKRAHRG